MLVDDPKSCEDLHDLDLNQELCIHITEDMLSAQNNRCSGIYKHMFYYIINNISTTILFLFINTSSKDALN